MLGIIAAQKGRQVKPPLPRLVPRSGVGVILHVLSQIVAKSDVHHIFGVVHPHPNLIASGGAVEDVVVSPVVALQPAIAPRRRLRLADAVADHVPAQLLRIANLLPVHVQDHVSLPFYSPLGRFLTLACVRARTVLTKYRTASMQWSFSFTGRS